MDKENRIEKCQGQRSKIGLDKFESDWVNLWEKISKLFKISQNLKVKFPSLIMA